MSPSTTIGSVQHTPAKQEPALQDVPGGPGPTPPSARRLARSLARRTATLWENLTLWLIRGTPLFASEQDREAPWGLLNRSDILNVAFKFVYGTRMIGDYFEFGCFTGRTFRMAYRSSRRPYRRPNSRFEKPVHLWAFDSFEGFPEPLPMDHFPGWEKGTSRMSLEEFHAILARTKIPRQDYTAIKGFYQETLTAERQQRMSGVKAAVVFVDCDFYESTKQVLEFLIPFFQQGTVICFDDYYVYKGSQQKGQCLAITEFLASHPQCQFLDYYRFGWHGRSFIVHVSDTGGADET